ncbi:uncharacterized protein [Oscarella lobularis]|uniref:uncharacterized protein n=1 Tax=Oscarella lobularis TaxID=121494 RepID=UPI003313CBCE
MSGRVGRRECSLGSSQPDLSRKPKAREAEAGESKALSLSLTLGVLSLYRLFSQAFHTKGSGTVGSDEKSSLEHSQSARTAEQELDLESITLELARLRDENRRLKSEASKNHQKSRSASERLVIGGFEKLDTETEDATAKVNAESSKSILIEALGKELESVAEENERLKAELGQHKLGYTKAYGHLQRLLSKFIIACMELPPCEKSSKLDEAFQALREEATKLLPPELSKSLLVALDVASSEEARENALRDSDDEDVVDLATAKQKIRKIKKAATEKTTHGLRRGRKAEMELKEIREEYEKKVNELTLEIHQLKEKYRRERRRNADMEKTLGSNSDYALFAAESVRFFVERCEMDRRELREQVKRLESELSEQVPSEQVKRLESELEVLVSHLENTKKEKEELSEEVKKLRQRAPNGIEIRVSNPCLVMVS